MKKICCMLALGAALLAAAPRAHAQLSAGAGLMLSTLDSRYAGTQQDKERSTGIYLGASLDIPLIEDQLKVVPGVYMSVLRGASAASLAWGAINERVVFRETALNIPVHLSYGFEIGYSKLFLYLGPTFQLGLTSRYHVNSSIITPLQPWTADGIIDNYKEFDYSRFNIYLGGGVGVDLNDTVRVTLGFDYGMLNLYTGDVPNTVYKRYNGKLGFAYLF